MTVIKDALNKAGYDEARHHFLTIVRNMLKQGKSAEWCIGIVREAAVEIPVAGQISSVLTDQLRSAGDRSLLTSGEANQMVAARPETCPPPARVPDCPGDHHHPGRNAHPESVSGAPQSRAADHACVVPQDQTGRVTARPPIASGKAIDDSAVRPILAVPPARDPSDSYLRAAAASAKATAKLMLDLKKTSTGDLWGDVTPRQFEGMVRDGNIAWAIKEAYGPFNDKQLDMKLREFIPDAVFRKALTIAEVKRVN